MADFNFLIETLIDAVTYLCSDFEQIVDMRAAETKLQEKKNNLREEIYKLENENKLLRGAILVDDERLRQAVERVGLHNFGCDNADVLADEIDGERIRNKELKLQLEVMTNSSNQRWEQIEKLKSINHNILEQLTIATDLGEKRFQKIEELQNQLDMEHMKFMDSQTEILFTRLMEKK